VAQEMMPAGRRGPRGGGGPPGRRRGLRMV